jgi:hypothetical protein
VCGANAAMVEPRQCKRDHSGISLVTAKLTKKALRLGSPLATLSACIRAGVIGACAAVLAILVRTAFGVCFR